MRRSTVRLRRSVLRMKLRPRSESKYRSSCWVVAVAASRQLHLGLDVHGGDLDALGLRDLREDQQDLDPLLGARPKLLVERVVGLARDLRVGLFGDPLPREIRAELVVHDLDFLLDQDVRQAARVPAPRLHLDRVGQLQACVGDGVVDDPVGELVARLVEGVALQPLADLHAERVQVLVGSELLGEAVGELGQHLGPKLLHVDLEMRRLAGEAGLRVVVRERDVELGVLADTQPDQVVLEARDQPVVADDQRHAIRRSALERLAVARAREGDDGVVALLGGPVLDRLEDRVLVAQLVEDLLDLLVVDRLDVGREVEVAVVAEANRGPDLDERRVDERLALLRGRPLRSRVASAGPRRGRSWPSGSCPTPGARRLRRGRPWGPGRAPA